MRSYTTLHHSLLFSLVEFSRGCELQTGKMRHYIICLLFSLVEFSRRQAKGQDEKLISSKVMSTFPKSHVVTYGFSSKIYNLLWTANSNYT